jgi:hypothetical protein
MQLLLYEIVKKNDENSTSVNSQIDPAKAQIIKKNRNYVEKLIENKFFLATQNIAFRGHDESQQSKNRVNYLEFIDFRKKMFQLNK